MSTKPALQGFGSVPGESASCNCEVENPHQEVSVLNARDEVIIGAADLSTK